MTAHLVTAIATAYCICAICTGHTHGITKSGLHGKPGRTIACDRKMLGAVIETPWGIRVCEDTGKWIKGNRIDILMATHEQAKAFGRQVVKIRMLGKKTLDDLRHGK